LISIPQVAGIAGMSHCVWLVSLLYFVSFQKIPERLQNNEAIREL
jgi:hypothetical protein